MRISIPDSIKEVSLAQVIQLGKIEAVEDRADYFMKEICEANPSKFHMADKQSLLSTFFFLLGENKVVSAPCDIKTKTLKLKLLKNPLEMKIKTFVELVSVIEKIKEDSFENMNIVTACFFRVKKGLIDRILIRLGLKEDRYNESELIKIAEELYDESLEYSVWGSKLYENLITLLQSTFPILYEGGNTSEEKEARRAYDMLNSLAKDDPTKWEEAENLTLHRAFLWMERKAIEADKRKQQGR